MDGLKYKSQLYNPHKHGMLHINATSNEIDEQILQELYSLRFKKKNIYYRKDISPWVDQCINHYINARKIDFSSAGLLYYYSFLNLAKAYLIISRKYRSSFLKSTAVYHGLSSDPQSIKNLCDFEIRIHPKISGNKHNIFSNLYESLTGHVWPFQNNIDIKLMDILPYCLSIGKEVKDIYDIDSKVKICSTVYTKIQYKNRTDHIYDTIAGNKKFIDNIEKEIDYKKAERLEGYANDFISESKNWHNLIFPSLNELHKYKFYSYRIKIISRIKTKQGENKNTARYTDDKTRINNRINKIFNGSAYPSYLSNNEWYLYEKNFLNNKLVSWHPILSDYLFSFIISTILRYQPYILELDGGKGRYIIEAWTKQSPIFILSNFLYEFSDPPIRIVKEHFLNND